MNHLIQSSVFRRLLQLSFRVFSLFYSSTLLRLGVNVNRLNKVLLSDSSDCLVLPCRAAHMGKKFKKNGPLSNGAPYNL